MPSSYLVTGGAGFIGSSIVRALLARGDKVRVIDNFFSGKRENLADVAGDIELIEGDIRDKAAIARACAGVEVVYHEAAIASVPRSLADPVSSNEANVSGTLNVLHEAKKAGVRRVVYAASSSAYGDTPTLPKIETMTPSPLSPYAVSKLAGEHYARVYTELFGLSTLSLRLFNVYGPGQRADAPYAQLVPRVLEDPVFTVDGDGTQSRDLVFVADVADAFLRALHRPEVTGVMNIGSGRAVTVLDVIAAARRTGPVEHGPGRAGDVPHTCADATRAHSLLAWRATVSLEEGLALTSARRSA